MESKLLVKIKGGNYSLWDYANKQSILPARPYVVEKTTFIMNKVAEDALEAIASLKVEATDEIFVKYLRQNKSNQEKGVKEFLKYYDENSKEKLSEAEKKEEAAAKKAAEETAKKAAEEEAAKKAAEEEAAKKAAEAEAAKKGGSVQNLFS